jgi:hypothetical protein
MDPQESYRRLIDAWINRNWEEVAELAQALLDWLGRGGFPPEPNYPKEMGSEWNRVAVRAVCEFGVTRANNVLEDANGIPVDVPFSLSCIECQADGPESFSDATSKGWQAIQYVPNSHLTVFLGICPGCFAESN